MREIEPPTGVDAVRAIRDRFLDAREAVTAAEQAIYTAQGQRGANLEPLYRQLEVAKDGLLEAQSQFQRIGQYGTSLEAQVFANQQRKAQELEAKKREEAQLAQNLAEKEAFKAEKRASYLSSGGLPEDFERRFNALWDAHVDEREARRAREMGQAWKDRYYSMHL